MRTFVLRTDDDEPVMGSETESIVYRLQNVELCFDKGDPAKHMGSGALYLTQSRIIWIGKTHAFDFDVRFIALHAISRDADSFPSPCLYCQLARDEDGGDGDDDGMEDEDDNMDAEDGGEATTTLKTLQDIASNALEMFIVPAAESELRPLFDAFSHASLQNPDPVEPGHEDDGEGFVYNVDEVSENQARILSHLESLLPPEP